MLHFQKTTHKQTQKTILFLIDFWLNFWFLIQSNQPNHSNKQDSLLLLSSLLSLVVKTKNTGYHLPKKERKIWEKNWLEETNKKTQAREKIQITSLSDIVRFRFPRSHDFSRFLLFVCSRRHHFHFSWWWLCCWHLRFVFSSIQKNRLDYFIWWLSSSSSSDVFLSQVVCVFVYELKREREKREKTEIFFSKWKRKKAEKGDDWWKCQGNIFSLEKKSGLIITGVGYSPILIDWLIIDFSIVYVLIHESYQMTYGATY